MDAELTRLEAQIEQLIGLYEGMKGSRRELLARVARLEAENHQLSYKLKLATGRLEAVLAKLPEG